MYPRLREQLARADVSTGPILLDMSATSYIDTYSLSEIIRTVRRWDQQSRPSAIVVGDAVFRTLSISGVIERLHAFRSLEAALGYLREAQLEP